MAPHMAPRWNKDAEGTGPAKLALASSQTTSPVGIFHVWNSSFEDPTTRPPALWSGPMDVATDSTPLWARIREASRARAPDSPSRARAGTARTARPDEEAIDCRCGLSGLGRRTDRQSVLGAWFAKVIGIFTDLRVLLRALGFPRPGGASCESKKNTSKPIAFEVSSKRRKGYPSETHVRRGDRVVGGTKELIEKLGRNDPCPCGSGRRF
jgi:SEC-C motif